MDTLKRTDFAFAAIDNQDYLQQGLTKRELFAAMAMQGILANPYAGNNPIDTCAGSVHLADCLIAELGK